MDKLDFRVGTLRDYLPDEAYQVACERAQRKVFADGDTLHSRGDTSPRLCIVADGAVRLGRFRPDGSFNLVTVLGIGGHFGDLGLQRAAYTHDGFAVGRCEIYVIKAKVLDDLLRTQPGFALGIWRCNTARLNAVLELYDDALTLGVTARLAKVIHIHMGYGELPDGVACRQRDFAELLGVSEVSIGNALRELEQAGLVATGYRCVRVPDQARLQDWLRKSAAI
ncbi:MAG: Crp/Fnr family transcriptional regulator [Halieaceae bacterium]|jgi:CRP-like cAMP-binding protein|nr:Crp/Fnr family transcriptional regulator [Halieaceae bacterium]